MQGIRNEASPRCCSNRYCRVVQRSASEILSLIWANDTGWEKICDHRQSQGRRVSRVLHCANITDQEFKSTVFAS